MDKTQKLDQELKKSVIEKRKAETKLIKMKIKKEKLEQQEIHVILDSLMEQNRELIEKTLNQSVELSFAKDESLKHKKYALELEEKLEEAIQEGIKLKQSESELTEIVKIKENQIHGYLSQIAKNEKYLKEKTQDFHIETSALKQSASKNICTFKRKSKFLKTMIFIQSMLLIGAIGFICHLLLR